MSVIFAKDASKIKYLCISEQKMWTSCVQSGSWLGSQSIHTFIVNEFIPWPLHSILNFSFYPLVLLLSINVAFILKL